MAHELHKASIELPAPGRRRGAVPSAGIARGRAVRLAVVALALAGLAAAAPFARAQTAASESVRSRHGGPEFTPIGMELDALMSTVGLIDGQTVRDKSSPAASFIVFPKLDMQTSYETNLFRNDSRKHDKVFVVSPQLSVKSDWARHSMSVALSSDIGRHVANPTEDYEDIRATVAGSVDVSDRVAFNASTQLSRSHQRRGELLDPGPAGGATIFVQSAFVLGANYKGDAFQGLAQLSITGVDYESDDGVDNSELNRLVTTFRVRGSYEFRPGTSIFIEPTLNERQFEVRTTSSGRLQGSDGWQMLAGFSWDVSGVTYAEFGFGYLQQDFDEPSFSTISGPSFTAKVIWNATEVLTLEAEGGRTVEETQDPDASGSLTTKISLRADYALRDDIMLSLGGRYAFEDIRGTDTTTDAYNVDLEARYLLSEYFYLRFVAGYDRNISSAAGSSFSNARASLSIGAQI